jgi:hypothetical protein
MRLAAYCFTVVIQCPLGFRVSSGFETGLPVFNALHEIPNLAVFVGLSIFLLVFHCDDLPTVRDHDVRQWDRKLCNLDLLATQGQYVRTSPLGFQIRDSRMRIVRT